MTAYSDIRGYRVKYLASDPTLNTSTEGQVWYNSTEGVLKSLVQIKAWSAGGNLPAVRSGSGGAGIQTAALNIGGENGAAIFGTTEEYSGYTWAAGGTLNSSPSFFMASGGTQTAALRVGGFTGPVGTVAQDAVEDYNGSSWASETVIPTATGGGMFAGTPTQGLFFGGQTPPTVTTSLSYDGTSWTTTNSLAVAKATGAGFGTQTAAIAAGGGNPALGPGTAPFTNNVQIWDGTNWTTTGSLNNSKTNLRGWGSTTSGAVAGGRTPAPSSTNQTELWDGTSWTSSATLGTAGYLGATAGGPGLSSGLYAGGGRAPSNNASTATEEFNSTIFSPATGAWASGGNMGTSRRYLAGAGTQTAGLAMGGYTNPNVVTNVTEEYDGSAWAGGGNLTTSRRSLAGAGLQTAALAFGGRTSSSPPITLSNATEEYNGSTWGPGGNLNTTRAALAACGTQTAALGFGGYSPVLSPIISSATEEYDGTSWASNPTGLGTGRYSLAGAGTQTAGLGFGGGPPGSGVSNTEEYDGSTWTAGGNLNTARVGLGGAGLQTAALAFAGKTGPSTPGNSVLTEAYDGTGWASTPPMATARNYLGSAGTQNLALGFGGYGPPASGVVNTEEWTLGSSAAGTASTLTTS